ncbi:hypothetical protein [Halopseudomonas yangmingensis]|uniref:Uncharacterized protein n=1 Tax=Halopseudomonas yangmingensis TaxID=1720063 RepID=A0A1I4U904_9GAMM|nr:hypothetical protein [Halopseudomonas yangmingensis]SFM85434.1 hypothetical protein SAMN05216217_1192 [Halopseudomonas yangmingensis]
MFNKLIWPAEAALTQDQSDQVAGPIPDYVTIVIMQQVADAIAARVSEEMLAGAAQSLCKALLESASQLACADQAQRICEDHGAVFTSSLDRSFSAAEGIYFYGEDFLIEHYSATGHWIESRLGELDSVCLDFVETSTSQPFAVCVCY